mgnify:CR=1 FL=1
MIEFEFEFAFGKKKRTIFDWVKLGVLLNFSIDTAAMLPWFSRKQVFNLVDSLQLKANYDFLNEYIINDREFLSYRLERELNRAIEDYEDYEL